MSFQNHFVVAATKCLAHCVLRPPLLSPLSSPLTQYPARSCKHPRVCCTAAMEEPHGGGKVGGENETPPPTADVQSRSVLHREVRAAVDNLNWPTLAARGWAPLPALAVPPPPEGRGRRGGRGGGEGDDVRDQCDDDDVMNAGGAGEGGRAGARLKFLTWNVLCDGLSGAHPTRGGFLMAPEGSLDWDKRRWKLLEEILKWDCDVLVLQEVDHHHDWLSPMLAKEGYRSLFVKKPVAPGMAFNPHLEDGCSLFYRATTATATAAVDNGGRSGGASTAIGEQGLDDRETVKTATTTRTTLDLLDAHTFTLAVVEQEDGTNAEEKCPGEGDSGQKNRPAEPVAGNQVAIISLFCVSSAGGGGGGGGRETLVIVATTHLKAVKDGHGEMIRARQAKQLLDEVTRFRAGHEQARGLPAGSIPVIVAGDFNATPHTSGGYDPLCYRQVTGHPLALKSALPVGDDFFTTWKIRPANPPPEGGAAEVSQPQQQPATRESKHCIDYVWVSHKVQPKRGSTLPSAEDLGPRRAPSFVYPSDHFAIAVDLRIP